MNEYKHTYKLKYRYDIVKTEAVYEVHRLATKSETSISTVSWPPVFDATLPVGKVAEFKTQEYANAFIKSEKSFDSILAYCIAFSKGYNESCFISFPHGVIGYDVGSCVNNISFNGVNLVEYDNQGRLTKVRIFYLINLELKLRFEPVIKSLKLVLKKLWYGVKYEDVKRNNNKNK